MACSCQTACSSAAALRGAPDTRGFVPRLACPPRVRRAAPVQAVGLLHTGGGSLSGLQHLAQGVGVALGALWVGSELMREQQAVAPSEDAAPECPTCEGTGVVDCSCNRWSDGDVGCGSCNGTGRTACHHCGGGGRAVPKYQRLTANRER